VLAVVDEPLFSLYLFIRLGQGDSAPSWAPIRSIKGVSRIVSFGVKPAKVAYSLVETLRSQEASVQAEPARLFKPGERVRLTEAPFAGRHRRHLPNGRWRAPSHGVDWTPLQASPGASCTGQPSQDWLKLGRNISQSHDGVAICH
jgi:hypothetical protein